MPNEDYYDAGYQPQKKGNGGGGFATAVIVIVVLLLAALVVGLFWPELLGGSAGGQTIAQPEVTQLPAATLPGEEEQEEQAPEKTGKPKATPVPEPEDGFSIDIEPSATPKASPSPTPVVKDEDRQLPDMDGQTPAIAEDAVNPIPDIFDAVAPGVVGIVNYQPNTYAGGKGALQVYGSGTGFIISTAGYIITNAHVVEDAVKVSVLMDDGEEIEALVIGADAETDVAVLKIEKSGLQPLELGDSDAVRVGEYALAIGNPLDSDRLANTLTYGIISAKAREITVNSYTNTYLQTDAAINFGNSGGPLLNMQGQVIGINCIKTLTAGYDNYGNPVSAEGIGFALPINQVKTVMELLITKGYVERPGVGITISTITALMSEEAKVPVGAYVESVVKDGPASKAGVKAGDIIVEADGKEITTQAELIDVVKDKIIGEELKIKVYRDGDYEELTIVLSNKTVMDFADVDD